MRPKLVELLCLPWAGASASSYLRWQRRLPSWVRIVPVELPGRGGRIGEAFVEDFAALADQLTAELEGMHGMTYALFGHSMGALLAYAITQRKRACSGPLPLALFASGSAGPVANRGGRTVAVDDGALREDLRVRGGTPAEVLESSELLEMALATLRADYSVCDSYRRLEGPPASVAIHALSGRQDELTIEQLQSWRLETTGAFTLDWFEGGHFFIRQSEERVLATIVRELQATTRAEARLFGGA